MNDMRNIPTSLSRSGEWTTLDLLMALPDHLSAKARLTYIPLWHDAGKMWAPSNLTSIEIMRFTGLSFGAQNRALKELVEAGLLSASYRVYVGGKWDKTVWERIVRPPLASHPELHFDPEPHCDDLAEAAQ